MTTAIMQSGAFYDIGDYMMKNQTASLSNTAMTLHNNSHTNNGLMGSTPSLSINNNNLLSNNSVQSQLLQNQTLATAISQAAAAAQRQQQQQLHINQQHQQQQKFLLHNTLSRTVSHPLPENQMVSLVSSLNVILGVGANHRKLERTQSEPLPQVNASRYKTELCRPFEEAGECKYGDKCQFAHGHHELRNLQRHPKYKTELCRTFHSVGFCPYGPRCHFVHNAEEARHHNRQVAAYHARLAQLNAQRSAAAGNNTSATNNHHHHHHMPLSPAMSMSTGSDRASPTGSLSLSPTSSMTSFFPEQNSPTFAQGFAFPQNSSPPSSPSSGMSPIATPPPPGEIDSRLPVFNRLSSTIDAFTKIAII